MFSYNWRIARWSANRLCVSSLAHCTRRTAAYISVPLLRFVQHQGVIPAGTKLPGDVMNRVREAMRQSAVAAAESCRHHTRHQGKVGLNGAVVTTSVCLSVRLSVWVMTVVRTAGVQ